MKPEELSAGSWPYDENGNPIFGRPWAEDELRDLRWARDHGETDEETAMFLCRPVEEVRKKTEELGLINFAAGT